MANPFKSGDKVLTFRKGIEIEATVRTTWNHEVQVRTTDGDLIWRTMKTIRSVTVPETDQPTDTPQNPEPPAGITQVEPSVDVPMQGAPAMVEPVTAEPTSEPVITVGTATVEPVTVEPTSEPITVEPDTTVEPTMVEPVTVEPNSQHSDPPEEPESQQPDSGAAKPKKRRKGILRKIIGDGPFVL